MLHCMLESNNYEIRKIKLFKRCSSRLNIIADVYEVTAKNDVNEHKIIGIIMYIAVNL